MSDSSTLQLKEPQIDDNLEFVGALNQILSSDREEAHEEISAEGLSPKIKKDLRRLARGSHLSIRQRGAFMAGVELDLLRPIDNRLGIYDLFRLYCTQGSRHWLNPLAELRKIDNVLLKFACTGKNRVSTLRPFIDLLINLGTEGINPTAFLQYVILSRLAQDHNWRKWTDNHLEALRKISEILVAMRKNPPFDRKVLGNELNRMVRDIVLIKYAGKPLARFPYCRLADEALNERYLQAWAKLSLDCSFTILFMKHNVLSFMYQMSGKIDYQQLIIIMENMPEIEEGFRDSFPDGHNNLDLRKIDLDLYGDDIHSSLKARSNKGFKGTDFVEEIKAYLTIISELINTRAGIYLCGFFARKLALVKDPVIAGCLARLISILHDNGGKHIYIWHTRRLLSKSKEEQASYLEILEANGGCDPEYPRIRDVFSVDSAGERQEVLVAAAHQLGLTIEDLQEQALLRTSKNMSAEKISRILEDNQGIRQCPDITSKDLLNAYGQKNPESESLIDSYREDFLSGGDRKWDVAKAQEFDGLGLALHGPLLKSIIRGLGTGFSSSSLKSTGFASLLKQYESIKAQQALQFKLNFKLPVSKIGSIDRLKEHEIRKKINLDCIGSVFAMMAEEEAPNPTEAIRYVNQTAMALNNSLRDKRELVLQLKEKAKQTPDQAQKEALCGQIEKLETATAKMEQKSREHEKILDLFPHLSATESLLAALFLAGKLSKPGDEFAHLALACILQRYRDSEGIKKRLEFLRADVVVEILTFKQLNFIINTLDTLFDLVGRDEELAGLLRDIHERNPDLTEALLPFVVTRKKKILDVSLDAALKKITAYNRLTGDRARWLQVLESVHQDNDRYFPKYSLYTSKSFLDIYYGDMGGICLSSQPDAMNSPRMFSLRLVSETDKEIIGMGLVFASNRGLKSYDPNTGIFWHAFAINPLSSFLSHLTRRKQLYLYLHYRKIYEQIAAATGRPVVLPGINKWGIISNNSEFRDTIVAFERRLKAPFIVDAFGLSLYYDETDYAQALVIIDPKRPGTFVADKLINSKAVL